MPIPTKPPGRRARRWAAMALAAGLVGAAFPAVSTGQGEDTGDETTTTAPAARALLPAPLVQTPPLLNDRKVRNAVAQIDEFVAEARARTGVPGVAVAVVYKDKVIYARGFGVREVGKPARVNADTVFQIASVSKPLSSTIVAGVVGRKIIDFDDPVIQRYPQFALSDPYVTQKATYADLLSHRSGLYTGAGDLLEDLGWEQDQILPRLVQQPLDPFRSSYNYSNFGYTLGGVAAATAAGTTWDQLAEQTLLEPLGMDETSFSHAVYESRRNKALIHVEVGKAGSKRWKARYVRDADAEAPAGGASSSVRDLAKFVRLHLADGRFDGERIIDAQALKVTHSPRMIRGLPATSAARAPFYGLGWNVGYDAQGRARVDHSGAFALGAATNVMMLPGEDLGIITLTNGEPLGIPEAINNEFFDAAQNGTPTVEWGPFFEKVFRAVEAENAPKVDYRKKPANPVPPKALGAYTGTFANTYYGPLTVSEVGGRLQMSMGPAGRETVFPLTHWNGDTFSFRTIGENANGLAGAIFRPDASGAVTQVTLDYYDVRGLGTFTR